MIDIKELTEEDIKRSVTYVDGTGDIEQGYITSYNDKFIFVDYGKNCGRGTATRPEDLFFMS